MAAAAAASGARGTLLQALLRDCAAYARTRRALTRGRTQPPAASPQPLVRAAQPPQPVIRASSQARLKSGHRRDSVCHAFAPLLSVACIACAPASSGGQSRALLRRGAPAILLKGSHLTRLPCLPCSPEERDRSRSRAGD